MFYGVLMLYGIIRWRRSWWCISIFVRLEGFFSHNSHCCCCFYKCTYLVGLLWSFVGMI